MQHERPTAVIAAGRVPVGARRLGGLHTPVLWGVAWGCLQAASPLAFPWLDAATVYALGLAMTAAVYFGFAVADGRSTVIAVEVCVASVSVVLAGGRGARAGVGARGRAGRSPDQGPLAAPHGFVSGTRW